MAPKKFKSISLLLILVLLNGGIFSSVSAQNENGEIVKYIFQKIETGLNKGNVDAFRYYLNAKVYLSLADNVSGYYTANHSFYVLEDYFDLYSPKGFKFDYVSVTSETPFAYGTYSYSKSGISGVWKVYISLEKNDHQWKITQITFN
ncbi:MAG: DUF4783 domain-containing protein [Chlorobi bacterium]|nr:DUF4783 domain-containing protein [Chlorobiota bacterium]